MRMPIGARGHGSAHHQCTVTVTPHTPHEIPPVVCRGCVAKRGESRVSRRRGRPPTSKAREGADARGRQQRGRGEDEPGARRNRGARERNHTLGAKPGGERGGARCFAVGAQQARKPARAKIAKKHPPGTLFLTLCTGFLSPRKKLWKLCSAELEGKGKSDKASGEICGPKDQSKLSQQAGGQEEELLLVLWFLASGLRPGLSQVSPPSIPRP